MNSIAFFLTILAVVACGQARVAREAPAAAQPVQLSDFISQAQASINDLGKKIQDQLNLPDQEAVLNSIRNQSSTLATNVQGYINKMTEDVKAKSPEVEKLWTDVKAKLAKSVDDLSAQLPDAKQQAAQLQAKFQEGVNALLQESDKVSKSISSNSSQVQEEIAKMTKSVVDMAVQASQSLNNQLQAAAPKA